MEKIRQTAFIPVSSCELEGFINAHRKVFKDKPLQFSGSIAHVEYNSPGQLVELGKQIVYADQKYCQKSPKPMRFLDVGDLSDCPY